MEPVARRAPEHHRNRGSVRNEDVEARGCGCHDATLPSVMDGFDVVEERIELPSACLSLLRPRDSEELLDEEAFEREEFLPYWADLWPSARALAAHLTR